ncbi:MAG: hypothetical protein AAF570_09510, partial [Bacteroidota bacterium]
AAIELPRPLWPLLRSPNQDPNAFHLVLSEWAEASNGAPIFPSVHVYRGVTGALCEMVKEKSGDLTTVIVRYQDGKKQQIEVDCSDESIWAIPWKQ